MPVNTARPDSMIECMAFRAVFGHLSYRFTIKSLAGQDGYVLDQIPNIIRWRMTRGTLQPQVVKCEGKAFNNERYTAAPKL